MIADVQSAHPDVVFFAEAFTRPKRMKNLAKLGFTMSYTYFTWKNTWWELRDYLEELQGAPTEYYRPNFFANTPDILPDYLVEGGRSAFRIRTLLAATLSPLYGIYSGFELGENVPVRKGSEEYLDSEKYEIKSRDWNAAGNINDDITAINRIRRQQVALQRFDNLTFHPSDNPAVLFYRKAANVVPRQWVGSHWQNVPNVPALSTTDDLLIAVTTDPRSPQETVVHVPIEVMGIAPDAEYVVHDLLTDKRYTWRGERNYIRLDPVNGQPAHVFQLIKA
jgi:starch synthase (maltosyl-transferring)